MPVPWTIPAGTHRLGGDRGRAAEQGLAGVQEALEEEEGGQADPCSPEREQEGAAPECLLRTASKEPGEGPAVIAGFHTAVCTTLVQNAPINSETCRKGG